MFKVRTNQKTKKVLVAVGKLDEKGREGMRQGFIDLGSALVRKTENNILSEPKYGREYNIKIDGVVRLHRASAPKQTPALLTGEYFEGLTSIPRGWQGLTFGNTAEHSEYLEEGTRKMEKRPGMFNAIQANIRDNRFYMETNLDREFQKI